MSGSGADPGSHEVYSLRRVGIIRSDLKKLENAPLQGSEGAPDAWLELDEEFARGLTRMGVGEKLIVITWLHRGDRGMLEVHPRGDPEAPLTGVFSTRSPHRPNPLGLHRVVLRELSGTRLRIGPIEAVDGTPVVDIKAVLDDVVDA